MSSLPTTTTTHVPTAVRPEGAPVRPIAAAPSGINFRQILAMLLRHIWLAVGLFILIAAITAAGYALCYRYLKEYTASGRMELIFKGNIMRGGGAEEDRPLDKWTIESRQREQVLRILSQQNLEGLLAQPEAQQWSWVEDHKNDKDWLGSSIPLVESLRRSLSASPVRETSLVEINMKDKNPEAAARMVNELMAYYERRSKTLSLAESGDSRRALSMEMDKVQFNLNRVNTSLNELRTSPDFENLERTRADILDRVNQLATMETQGMLFLEQAKRQLEGIRALYQDPDSEASIEIRQAVANSVYVANLTAKLQALLEERSQLEKRFLPKHSIMIEYDTRIEEVQAAIEKKKVELTGQEKQRATQAAEANLMTAKSQLDTIQTNLRDAKEKKKQLENLWAQYNNLQSERATAEAQVQQLTALIREIDVKISRGAPPMGVFIQAATPRDEEFSFPRWELFLTGGLLLALALSIGLVLLIELVDTSVRTPRDLSEQVRLPLLGFVPLARGSMPLDKLCRLVVSEPMSLIAESFRQIRTNLLFAAPADQLSSLAVTSASRDEGKTAVAANLAITIALSGRKVLLVDANFRRPVLASAFALAGEVGLSNVLTDQSSLAGAAKSTDVPNLSVLPAGPTPPNPTELVGSATMRAFLDQAQKEYDLIIFDGPPALLVSDGLVLASMVDGIIAVVRASQTSRGMVTRLRDQLHKVNARIVGAVLNAARPTRGGYFRKSQQQYEEYHNLPAGQ